MGLRFVTDLVGNVQDNVVDRGGEVAAVNPGEFLQSWITEHIPNAVVNLATRIGGREDGSGLLAQQALEMGQDENLLGGVLRQ